MDGPAIGPLPASDNFPVTVGGSTPCVDEVYRKTRRGGGGGFVSKINTPHTNTQKKKKKKNPNP
ncbi:hypothetical protein Q0S19_05160, partial [Stenotrophomonas indicatrix]|uniref:hypothetical protein n=1 Tax=Stenotrophomonas indicatrix TaxID=2045451 RepID=UPI002650C280